MPCRETGIVLIIEFNLLCNMYDKQPSIQKREQLIRIIRECISHFDDEQDTVRDDFRLIILLKASFVYLGIALFCEIVNVPVSCEFLKHAESCLQTVKRKWNQVLRDGK